MSSFGLGQYAALNPAHLKWCRNLWERMNDGATWIVPRSNSVLTRHGHRLEFQGDDEWEFNAMKVHFEAIGVPVERGTMEPPNEGSKIDV